MTVKSIAVAVAFCAAAFLQPVHAAEPPASPAASPARPLDAFEALDQQFREEQKRTEVAKARGERERAERELGTAGPSGAPVLVRVVGKEGGLVAFFIHGGGEYPARVGETIADGMQVTRITARAVDVTTADGNRRTLYLGSGTLKAAASAGPTPVALPVNLPSPNPAPPASAPK